MEEKVENCVFIVQRGWHQPLCLISMRCYLDETSPLPWQRLRKTARPDVRDTVKWSVHGEHERDRKEVERGKKRPWAKERRVIRSREEQRNKRIPVHLERMKRKNRDAERAKRRGSRMQAPFSTPITYTYTPNNRDSFWFPSTGKKRSSLSLTLSQHI